MFGIGLGLSLSKFGCMGWFMLIVIVLGVFFMFNFIKLFGFGVGWSD